MTLPAGGPLPASRMTENRPRTDDLDCGMPAAIRSVMTTDLQLAPSMDTLPPPSGYDRALQRERLDAAILRALGERRAQRTLRINAPSEAWDDLEQGIMNAATTLWEIPASATKVYDDLLAFCAFVARELEVTESMDLTADEERVRFEALAPRALAALDEITGELVRPRADSDPVARALASAFGTIRARLAAACVTEWLRAA